MKNTFHIYCKQFKVVSSVLKILSFRWFNLIYEMKYSTVYILKLAGRDLTKLFTG